MAGALTAVKAALPVLKTAGTWLVTNAKPIATTVSAIGSLVSGNKNKPAPQPQQQKSPQQQQLENQLYQQVAQQANSQLGQQAQEILQQRLQNPQQVIDPQIEQQMYDRMRDRINQEYDQQQRALAESMNARGMYNSNIMSNAEMRLGEWRNRALSDVARDIALENFQRQLNQDNYNMQLALTQGQQGMDNALRMLTGYASPQQQQAYQAAYNEWLLRQQQGAEQRRSLAEIAAMLGRGYLGDDFFPMPQLPQMPQIPNTTPPATDGTGGGSSSLTQYLLQMLNQNPYSFWGIPNNWGPPNPLVKE